MVQIVKATNRNEQAHFRLFQWWQIILIAVINGWHPSDKDRMAFDEENSKQFCAALKKALREIANDLLPLDSIEQPICPRIYLGEVTKANQLELIDEFLRFCEDQPFQIKVKN
jgi:hypothetical protein